jgi:FMN phosphatase YigB (HAD superfamily)
MNDLIEIWKDQKRFNKNFWPDPKDDPETQTAQTKEFVLLLMSELDELLRTTAWKKHRKQNVLLNPAQIKNELTDIFKYWLSLCQVWGFSPEDMVADYWRKSMVVEQRYSEEHVLQLKGPIALVDIDGVLANYREGVLEFLRKSERYVPGIKEKAEEFLKAEETPYVNASLFGLEEKVWQVLKHKYRVSGGKFEIDCYDDAEDFLVDLRLQGYQTVLITSRPIDRYPNIFSDTMFWLRSYNLHVDAIWWAMDKKEKVSWEGIVPKVAFAVDDELENCEKFASLGIQTYHLIRPGEHHRRFGDLPENVREIKSLKEIEIAGL